MSGRPGSVKRSPSKPTNNTNSNPPNESDDAANPLKSTNSKPSRRRGFVLSMCRKAKPNKLDSIDEEEEESPDVTNHPVYGDPYSDFRPVDLFQLLPWHDYHWTYMLYTLIKSEAIVAFFMTLVPAVVGYMNIGSAFGVYLSGISTSLTGAPITLITSTLSSVPGVAAVNVALASSLTMYVLYAAFPGATGNPYLALDQMLLEWATESKPLSRFDYQRRNPFGVKILYVSKFVLTVVVQMFAALCGVYLAQYAANVPSTPASVATFTGTGPEELRVIVLEAFFFGLFVTTFNRVYRVFPHEDTPFSPMGDRSANLHIVVATQFIGVFVLFGLTGSVMNCLLQGTWALVMGGFGSWYFHTFYAYFVGEFIGAIVPSFLNGMAYVSVMNSGAKQKFVPGPLKTIDSVNPDALTSVAVNATEEFEPTQTGETSDSG